MRITQTPERLKEAPAHALRAMVAGVGQVLLLPGRVRRRTFGQEHSAPVSSGAEQTLDTVDTVKVLDGSTTSTGPVNGTDVDDTDVNAAGEASTAKTSTAKTSTAKTSTAKASTTKTSTGKTSGTKAAAAKTGASKTSTVKASTTKTGTAKPRTARATTAARSSTVKANPGPSSEAATADLPLAGYGELSLASLRARMRSLDVAQVRQLLDYERAHEGRENVVAMFERRVAKLEGTKLEGTDDAG